jgi:hypothetical protein
MRRSVILFLLVVLVGVLTVAAPAASAPGRAGRASSVFDAPGWVTIASLSGPLVHQAGATGSQGVYEIGGDTVPSCQIACQVTDQVEYYSPQTNTWSQVAPLPTPLNWVQATTGVDGRVYALGGYSPACGCITTSAEVYTPSTNSWAQIAPLPAGRVMAMAATGLDGRIYLIGGASQFNQGSTTVFVYTPGTNTWKQAASTLTPQGNTGAATGPDGRIFVFGGQDSEAYDPATNSWSAIAPWPDPVGYSSAATGGDGRIYEIGGTQISIYDPSSNSWSTGPSPHNPHGQGGAAGGDGRIYAVGADGLSPATAEALATVAPPPPPTLDLGRLFKTHPKFLVTWNAPPGQDAASFDLRYRSAPYTADFGPPTGWQTGTTQTSARFIGLPGYTYCFSARLHSPDGKVSDWSSEQCASLPVDDPALTAQGSWTRNTGADGYYLDTFSLSTTRLDTLTLSGVEAKRLALVATLCPGCGRVDVFWNGNLLQEVDLGSPARQVRKLFLLPAFPDIESGTATVMVISARSKPVEIDGLGISRE